MKIFLFLLQFFSHQLLVQMTLNFILTIFLAPRLSLCILFLLIVTFWLSFRCLLFCWSYRILFCQKFMAMSFLVGSLVEISWSSKRSLLYSAMIFVVFLAKAVVLYMYFICNIRYFILILKFLFTILNNIHCSISFKARYFMYTK